MEFTTVLLTALIIGLTGLIIGMLLTEAGERFQVKENEKERAVRRLLPGNNCGGCGYAGCDGLAKAIVAGEAPADACPVGGISTARAVSKVMGTEMIHSEKYTAFVRCAGSHRVTREKYHYSGIKDCRGAAVVPRKGAKACLYGCMGFGACVSVCRFDAIHVINGVAVVDKEKCTGCGRCADICPNHLIELVPDSAKYLVRCASREKGNRVKEACDSGCISCTLCIRQCPEKALAMEGNVVRIDYDKCTGCGICAEKCPRNIICLFDLSKRT